MFKIYSGKDNLIRVNIETGFALFSFGKNYFCSMNFITGSTGLVGGYLILELLKRGEKVRALRRSTSSMDVLHRIFEAYEPDNWEAYLKKIEWVEGDVLNYHSLEEAMKDVKDVYHSAGFVSYQPRDKAKIYQINQKGTENMVNAAMAQNVRKFCYVSSISALGSPKHDRDYHTEEDFFQTGDTNTHYGYSKYYGEQEVWRAAEEGLNMVIVNPSVILGYGDPEKGSTKLFTKVYDGLKFYTPGSTGFIDVRDVVNTTIALTKGDFLNERYILNAENRSFYEVFGMVADALGKTPPHIKASPWMGEVYWRLEAIKSYLSGKQAIVTKETARAGQRQSAYSNEKVKKALDYDFIPLEESIKHIGGLIKKTLD